MNIIVHYLTKKADKDALTKRVAFIHARAVANYLQKLPCPEEQKIQIYEEIKHSLLKNG